MKQGPRAKGWTTLEIQGRSLRSLLKERIEADNRLPWKSGKSTFRKAIICALILFSLVSRITAQNYLVGVRAGSSFENDAGDFQQVDVFAAINLPWVWGFKNGLNVKPQWEGSVGWLHDSGQASFIGTTGPVLELRFGKFPVTLAGGASVAALSRYNFPDRDLGGWFQFTDHIGVNWHVTKN